MCFDKLTRVIARKELANVYVYFQSCFTDKRKVSLFDAASLPLP